MRRPASREGPRKPSRGGKTSPRKKFRKKIAESGGKLRVIDVISAPESSTVDEELERLRARSPSWTWEVPSGPFDDALPSYENWLRAAVPGGSWTDDVMIQLEVWHWD